MNKTTKKRALSLFLSFIMILTSLPVTVFADYLNYYEEETTYINYYIVETIVEEYEEELNESLFSPYEFSFSEGVYTIFSLQDELALQGPGTFTTPGRLQGAGVSPYIAEIEGALYLGFVDRSAGWNGIDIHREGLYIGDTLEIAGFAVNPPAGTNMILGGAESPWNWANNVLVSEEETQFLLQLTLTETHFLEDQFVRFRVQTNGEGSSMDFYLYEIRINRTEASTPFVPPVEGGPEPELPVVDGELVFNLSTYDYVLTNGVTDFSSSVRLSASGSPTITRYNGSLYVTNRNENWHTIDVNLVDLNLGATYFFYASGTAPAGMQIGFHRSDAPWNFMPGSMITTPEDGRFEIGATLVYPPNPSMPALRIQTNNAETVDFVIDNIRIYRIEDAPLVFETLYSINEANMAYYAEYLSAGDQMSGVITPNGFRLQNITGDYTSGNGNYLRFDLPYPILPATDLRISWDVFIPSAENPGNRNIVGPGLVINSNFGQAPSQPTNNIDLNRTIPMDEWVNTSVEFMVSHEVGDELNHLIFRFRVNDNIQQPTVLYINNIVIQYGGAADFVAPQWDLSLPSLAEAFAPFFSFGNIYATHAIMNQFGTRDAFVHHFNAITAENWHKPDHIAGPGGLTTRPAPEDFNFSSADAIVDFAIENNLQLIGHAFVWHSQTPAWMFGPEGARLTRQEARDNMEFYIRTLSEHFTERGTINAFHSWDVVNEVIESGGGTWGGPLDDFNAGDWRTQMRTQSGWWEAYSNNPNPAPGEHPSDFVYDAFVFARRYFPNTILYYNDYNEEIPAKRNAIAQMIEQINERWAHDFINNPEAVPFGMPYNGRKLIEGFGLQSHFHYPMGGWSTNFDNIRPALERFAATGVILSISELDITFGGFGGGAQSFPDGLPEEWAVRQAEIYARLIGYYLEFSNYIERLSIWGLADNQSWRAAGHPLLFDSQFNAKPAFFAILDAVNNFDGPFFELPVVEEPPVIIAPFTADIVFEAGSTQPQFIDVVIENDHHSVSLFTNAIWPVVVPPVPAAARLSDDEPAPAFSQWEIFNELITWDNENSRIVINPGLPDLPGNGLYSVNIQATNEFGTSFRTVFVDVRDNSVTSAPTITASNVAVVQGGFGTFDFEITENPFISPGFFISTTVIEGQVPDWSWFDDYIWQQLIEVVRFDFRNHRLIIEGSLPNFPDGFSLVLQLLVSNRYGSVIHEVTITESSRPFIPWQQEELDEEPALIVHRWLNQSSSWTTYSEDTLAITVDGQTANTVVSVTVNGRALTRGTQFVAPAGTSRIELLPSFLETLSAGTHVLEVLFFDNTIASTIFTVIEGTPPAVETSNEEDEEYYEDEEYEEVLPVIEETIEEASEDSFVDISPLDWFYQDVSFVLENGIMNGMSTRELRFEPNTNLSFAMLIRALYNLEGLSNGTGQSWYESPLAWAIENNIIEQLDNPLANVEIEDLVLILTNYAQFSGTAFPDLLEEALSVEFEPLENVTRAEFATIIRNFIELP